MEALLKHIDAAQEPKEAKKDAKKMFQEFDDDKSGTLEFEEFRQWWRSEGAKKAEGKKFGRMSTAEQAAEKARQKKEAAKQAREAKAARKAEKARKKQEEKAEKEARKRAQPGQGKRASSSSSRLPATSSAAAEPAEGSAPGELGAQGGKGGGSRAQGRARGRPRMASQSGSRARGEDVAAKADRRKGKSPARPRRARVGVASQGEEAPSKAGAEPARGTDSTTTAAQAVRPGGQGSRKRVTFNVAESQRGDKKPRPRRQRRLGRDGQAARKAGKSGRRPRQRGQAPHEGAAAGEIELQEVGGARGAVREGSGSGSRALPAAVVGARAPATAAGASKGSAKQEPGATTVEC